MLEKRHQLLVALSKDLKCFDDVELVFPLDKFQVGSIFNMITENKNKPWLPADKFWFLLILSTCATEVRKKKLCTKTEIAQPPRQLQG